jgi:hypothetical protein
MKQQRTNSLPIPSPLGLNLSPSFPQVPAQIRGTIKKEYVSSPKRSWIPVWIASDVLGPTSNPSASCIDTATNLQIGCDSFYLYLKKILSNFYLYLTNPI